MVLPNITLLKPQSEKLGLNKRTFFLQAALNGYRIHPAAPRIPAAIAEAARASVDTGAQSVHVHAFADAGARLSMA